MRYLVLIFISLLIFTVPVKAQDTTVTEIEGLEVITVEEEEEKKASPKYQTTEPSALISEARQLYEAGELEGARKLLKSSLSQLEAPAYDEAEDLLAEINNKILFEGDTNFPGLTEHQVKPGESLYVIAKKYKTTPDFITALNNVKGTIIYPDQKLRVVSVPISINISKAKNRMEVYLGSEIIRTYSVATGKDNSTPVGTFTIETKIENPTWYKTGAVIPPGAEENILGSRWLGFSLEGYGIHGTTLPETIGTQSTAGCIRMNNADVEELYAMVPPGSTVTIVD